MAKSGGKVPLVDISGLRHDIHRLLVLLFADEKLAQVDAFDDLSNDYHEREVNRLLIWISIASRQLLDIDAGREGQTCGRICPHYPDGDWQDLTFRRACDTIIHAVEIIPYEVSETQEDQGQRECYRGKITIRGRRKRSGRNVTRAEIHFQKFAECCTLLAGGFLKD